MIVQLQKICEICEQWRCVTAKLRFDREVNFDLGTSCTGDEYSSSREMGNTKYAFLHSLQLGLTIFSLYYDYYYVDFTQFGPKNDIKFYKGRLKFLTLWNMLLQAVFFSVALLNDLIGTNASFPEKPVLIRKIKDIIFASLAFPMAAFVAVTFWALYLVDRELVLPRALDPYFPLWLNHCMHTNIVLFVALELTTTFRRYPKRSIGVSILAFVMISYLVWIHVVHAYTNTWVYPILDVLNLPLRIVFFVSSVSLALVFYYVGEYINNKYWKDMVPTPKRSSLAPVAEAGKKKKRRGSKVVFDVPASEQEALRRRSNNSDSGTKVD